ncbi:hypothetical protein LTR84_010991 [Exophiala bonariae]|uniref:RRM domain-containing protein n=1 Tax=Exophiala bonariae TaxID=1690606 RepID=A0AAV9NHX8_9EURO|nr:hypothetical protein LTR84_010991 [Exophiala bonariae]
MPQERQRARDSSKDDAQFIIIVKDIPRQCRWQELKDMTRHLGGEQSLKAEVFELRDGSQLGHCTVKGRTAANQVYEGFLQNGWNGLSVFVSLAILEKGALTSIEGPKKTVGMDQARSTDVRYSCAQEASALHNHVGTMPYTSSNTQTGSTSYGTQYSFDPGMTSSTSTPNGLPLYASGMTKYPYPYQIAPAYNTTPVRGDYPTSPTHYAPSYPTTTAFSQPTSKSRPPVNDGTSVFLSGLPYYHSEIELRNTLRAYGHLTYLEIHPDSRKLGKGKGTARARFQTPQQALTAIRGLDGRSIGGRKISVKQVKDDIGSGYSTTNTSKPVSDNRTTQVSISSQKKIHKRSKSSGGAVSSSTSTDKSHGTKAHHSSNTGPLVVNGARSSGSRRNSRDAASESDESSEDSNCESSDNSSDDEEDEDEPKLSSAKRGMCLLFPKFPFLALYPPHLPLIHPPPTWSSLVDQKTKIYSLPRM